MILKKLLALSTLKKHIPDKEYLYRGVIMQPNFWNFERNRPSSAVFKDSSGVSVDREGKRNENDIESYLKKNNTLRAIVKIKTGDCRVLDTYPKYNPVVKWNLFNPFHSLILGSKSKIKISSGKAKRISNKIEIFSIYDSTPPM